jgi:UTP--glucose-1-phosphate uridylyltransferase
MKIKKAIIPAAGFGTRFLPITKTIQKEMLPILSKPIIDYLVDDCVNAGIEEIVFVVNENDDQIQDYYRENLYFKRYLERMNKADRYDLIGNIHSKAKFSFVYQKESDLYGTAVPVWLAKDFVKNEEAFLVVMGDDYFYNSDGSNEISKMIDVFEKSNSEGLVTCIRVPKNLVSKYGIAEFKEENGYKYLINQIEKPQPEEVTSDFVTISKFIFTPEIYKYINLEDIDQKSGELFLTTAYTKLAKDKKMVIYEPKGEYLDSGYVIGWLKANIIVAKDNPVIWAELEPFLREKLG